jgi:adenylosuccinate lyase
MVQKQAMRAWKKEKDFKQLVVNDPDIRTHLKAKEIEDLFDVKAQLRHVNTIFARVFGTKRSAQKTPRK